MSPEIDNTEEETLVAVAPEDVAQAVLPGGIDPSATVTLSAAELNRLLSDVVRGGGMLPPGAFREQDGVVYRYVLEPTGRMRPVKGPDGKPTGRFESVNRRVRRAVYLTYDMSPQGLIKGKRAAQVAGLDFYHPKYGWLRNGTKREVEVEENLGSGAQSFEMVYDLIEVPDEDGPAATVQGVAVNEQNIDHDGDAGAGSGLASWDDALAEAGDVPRDGRRKKG